MIIVHCRMRPPGPVAGSPCDSTRPDAAAFCRSGGKSTRGAAPAAAIPKRRSMFRRLTFGGSPDVSWRSLASGRPSLLPVILVLHLSLVLAGSAPDLLPNYAHEGQGGTSVDQANRERPLCADCLGKNAYKIARAGCRRGWQAPLPGQRCAGSRRQGPGQENRPGPCDSSFGHRHRRQPATAVSLRRKRWFPNPGSQAPG